MTQKLEGKVAIITGASAGIGVATAIALAAEGAFVAIAARRADKLNEVAQKIEASGVSQPERVDVNEILIRPTTQVW